VKKLGALEALGRGLANVHANWQVVLVSVAGSVLLVAIVLASLFPWIAALGLDVGRLLAGQGASGGDLFNALRNFLSPQDLLARLGAGLLAFTLGLTLASVVYAWYYGGVLGVLVAGDAQAPAGAGRASEVFRTWSGRFFLHEAARLTWRVLVYYSVVLTLLFGVLLLAGALLVVASLVANQRSPGAALAIGCGGMLPLLFAMLTINGAGWLGLGELPRPGGSVRSAIRLGYRIFGRRLGACLGLIGLFVLLSLTVGMFFGLVNLIVGAARMALGISAAVESMVFILQLGTNSYLSLVFLAAAIALLRSETVGTGEVLPA